MEVLFFVIVLLIFGCIHKYYVSKEILLGSKYYNFDIRRTNGLRGIMALGVVISHVTSEIDVPPFSYCNMFGTPAVSIFLFLSGYGVCKSLIKKGDSYLDTFLNKRLSRILPLYLLATIFMIIVGWIELGEFKMEMLHVFNELKGGFQPLPFSWFIAEIIVFYLFFYAFSKNIKNYKNLGIAIIMFCCLFSGLILILQWKYVWYVSIFNIPLGYFVALYEKEIDKFKEWFTPVLGIALILGFFSYYLFLKFNYTFFIYNLLISVIAYLGIRLYGFYDNRVSQFFGNLSFEIYLLHGVVMQFIMPCHVENWIKLISVLLITIAIAWVYNVIEKRIQKTFYV